MPMAKYADASVAVRVHFMFTLFVATAALVFVVAALVAPRWLQRDGDSEGASLEERADAAWSPLYHHSRCLALWDSECGDLRKERLTTAVLSVIEIITAVIAVMIAGLVACRAMERHGSLAAGIVAFVVALAAIVSCILGGTTANKDYCGSTKSQLLWAFAFRVAEAALAVLMTALCAIQATGRLKPGFFVLQMAVVMTGLCAASVVGVAWERRTIPTPLPVVETREITVGLWEACQRIGDGCETDTDDRLVVTLALTGATVALLGLYLLVLATTIVYKVLLLIASAALACCIAIAVVFPEWSNRGRCDAPSPRDQGYDPTSGVYLFAIGGILTAVLFLLSLVRICLKA